MNLKTGFKKKLYKFRYLEQEFLEYEELDKQGKDAFMADLREVHAKMNVYDAALDDPFKATSEKSSTKKSDTQNSAHQETQEQSKSKNNEQVKSAFKKSHDAQIKKLYRKIAMKLHPDKLSKSIPDEEKDYLIKKFEKITEDYQAGDYSSLLLVMDELNIILDNYKPEWLDIIDQKILEFSQKIIVLKKSMYIVYAQSSDVEKKKILRAFMKERGWTSNLSAVKKSRKKNGNPGKSLSWARKLGEDN